MRRLYCIAGISLLVTGRWVMAQTADTIYHNGPIITINDAQPMAEAVAVKDGQIIAVGQKDDVLKTMVAATKLIDLEGRTMLPGFVDAHGHVMGGGLQALSANILSPPDGEVKDIASLQQTLRDWMAASQEAVNKIKLVVGFGYDNAQLTELRHPHREDLDVVSEELPIVLIHQSGHLIAVNSKALELGDITPETPNPPGGVIQRREDGKEPNGVLEETAAFPLLLKLLGRVGPEGAAAFFRSGTELWARFGYTTAQDGRTMPGSLKTMTAVADSGVLKIDVVSYPDVLVDRELIKKQVSQTYKNRFRVAGAKLTIDGSPQGFTAWRDRPYYKPVGNYPPGYSGYAAATPEQVGDAIDWAFANSIQLLTHSNGEAASDQLIAFIAAATKEHGGGDRRPVLIHGQFLREDQVDALNTLGVLPSLFPMHTFYWGDWHRDHTVGPVLADNISPTGWCVERGMKFTSHHDAPVAFPDSMRVLDATVTRRSRSGDIIGPAQRVNVMTALKAMTIWPAWQHFEEQAKGSIEVGKLADFVILDKNPLTVDPETLDRIRVTETIKEGVTIYAMTTEEEGNKTSHHDGTHQVFARMLLALGSADSGISSSKISLRTSARGLSSPPCPTCVCGTLSDLVEVVASRRGDRLSPPRSAVGLRDAIGQE
jgi:predicted amidohydrolase YtcJ